MITNPLIALSGDFPAKTSVSLVTCAESTRPEADYGPTSPESLGVFDPDTYSLKTSQVSLLTNQCDEYLETFPRAGTMRSGRVFQRPALVPRTSATGFGYLPTPDKSTGGNVNGGTIRGRHNIVTCFQKETSGIRKSGAAIGSSLIWCREFMNEWLRTGGMLNPEWLEVLMGFPKNWSMPGIQVSEILSSLKSASGSGAKSSKRKRDESK